MEKIPATTSAHQRVVKALRPLILSFAVFALGLVISFLAFTTWADRDSDLIEEEDYLLSLSASVSAHTDSIFQEIAFTLTSLDRWILSHPHEDPRRSGEFQGYIDDVRTAMKGLIDIHLIDTEGEIFSFPGNPKDASTNVGDRSYFLAQQDPATRGYMIGDPVQSRLDGRWFLPVSMPLHENGMRLFVILATVDLQKLDAFYTSFLPQKKGAITLIRNEGTVLMRTPFNTGYLGAKASETAYGARIPAGGKQRENISYTRGIDGFNRIIAHREVGERGVVVAVSSTRNEVLASWRARLPYIMTGGVLLIGIVLFITWRVFIYLSMLDKLRTRLLDTIEKLEENRSTKDKLISIVSHDLRGPVGGIKSLLETILLEQERLSPEELHENLAALSEAADNTYKLLDDLLTWSRSQRGTMIFEPVTMAFLPIAEDCLEDVSPQCAAKGVKVAIEAEPGTGIHADENMLRITLRNLVTNAVKFSHPGGRIVLAARNLEGGTEVTVSDEGEGMDPDMVGKIFKIGAIRSRDGTAGEKGTGLGLPVVKDFMDRHGGRISVRSAPGSGSSFILFFPSRTDPVPEARDRGPGGASPS